MPQRAHLVFGFLVAAVIAGAIKIVGVLLIVAVGIVAVAGGLFASAELDTPSGPSIVVTALTLFALTRIRRSRRA